MRVVSKGKRDHGDILKEKRSIREALKLAPPSQG